MNIDDDLEYHEAIARKKAAWGMYAARMRMNAYDESLENFDRKIREASSSKERDRLKKEKKEFEDAARRSTMYIVGGC